MSLFPQPPLVSQEVFLSLFTRWGTLQNNPFICQRSYKYLHDKTETKLGFLISQCTNIPTGLASDWFEPHFSHSGKAESLQYVSIGLYTINLPVCYGINVITNSFPLFFPLPRTRYSSLYSKTGEQAGNIVHLQSWGENGPFFCAQHCISHCICIITDCFWRQICHDLVLRSSKMTWKRWTLSGSYPLS